MDTVKYKGGEVAYHDPHIPVAHTHDGKQYHSVELTAETLKNADVVILTTNHSAFDVDFIQQHSQMIVDLRNMVSEKSEKVYKL
jgi:UDP-N-acetyl-D-glucosamine dehydrogenase